MMQKCPSTLSYVQTDRIWYFSLLDPLACGNPKAAEKGLCIWSPPRRKIFVTGIFFNLSEVFSQGQPEQKAECLSWSPPQVLCIFQAEDMVPCIDRIWD